VTNNLVNADNRPEEKRRPGEDLAQTYQIVAQIQRRNSERFQKNFTYHPNELKIIDKTAVKMYYI
jgi:hypothetical protein